MDTICLREFFIFLMFAIAQGACGELDGVPRSPCGDSLTVPLSDELLAQLGAVEPAKPKCRPAASGEILINEVVIRPAGRDLDGDGKSGGRDEVIELVSLANEQVHLQGARLVYKGKERGEVKSAVCLRPYHAALLVGSTTGNFEPPDGAVLVRLNKTLRLTDSGGPLALVGVAAKPLDSISVPPASNASEGGITRAVDGSRKAALVPHSSLAYANGALWSPGTCVNGEPFPDCVSEGVIDREAYLRDPMVP